MKCGGAKIKTSLAMIFFVPYQRRYFGNNWPQAPGDFFFFFGTNNNELFQGLQFWLNIFTQNLLLALNSVSNFLTRITHVSCFFTIEMLHVLLRGLFVILVIL